MEEDGRIENLFKYWHLHNKDGQRNICCWDHSPALLQMFHDGNLYGVVEV